MRFGAIASVQFAQCHAKNGVGWRASAAKAPCAYTSTSHLSDSEVAMTGRRNI